MKNEDIAYLLLGGFVIYLLAKNAYGVTPAQAAINQTNLQAAGTVSNVNTIANAAQAIGGDIGNVVTDVGMFGT